MEADLKGIFFGDRFKLMTIDELYEYIRNKSGQAEFDQSLSAVIDLNINGNGPEAKLWRVKLNNGRACVDDSGPDSAELAPDVAVSLDETTLLKMALGEMAPVKAFLLGRVKIKGDKGLLGQLKYLWPESRTSD